MNYYLIELSGGSGKRQHLLSDDVSDTGRGILIASCEHLNPFRSLGKYDLDEDDIQYLCKYYLWNSNF